MKWLRAGVYSFLAIITLAALVTAWLLTTGSGARFILARSEGFFPPALSLDGLSGSLLGGLELELLTWSDDAVDVRVEGIDVDLELLPLAALEVVVTDLDVASASVAVRERETVTDETPGEPFTLDLPIDILLLDAVLDDISLTIAGSTRRIDRLTLGGSLNGPRLVVRRLTVASDWLTLESNGRLRIDPDLGADLRADWALAGETRLAGALRLDGDRDEYDIEHRLSLPAELVTDGRIAMRDGLSLDLVHRWQEIEWPLGERQLRSSEGRLETLGPLDALALRLDANASLDGLPPTEVQASATTDLAGLDDIELSLASEIGSIAAAGELSWESGLDFSTRFEIRDADPSVVRDELNGALEADGSAAGRIREGTYEIDTVVERFGGLLNGFDVSGSGQVLLLPGEVTIRDSELRVGNNQLNANGSIGETLAIVATVDARDLSQLLPSAAGAVRGNASIGGSLGQPSGKATLSARSLAYGELSLEALDTSLEIDASRQIAATLRSTGIEPAGQRIDSVDIAVNGSREQHRIRIDLEAIDTAVAAEARGALSKPAWSGVLETLSIDNAIAGAWMSRDSASLSISPTAAELARLCLDGKSGSACIDGTWSAAGGSAANLDVDALPLSALPLGLPATIRANGLIFADAALSLLPEGMTGQAEIRIDEASVGTVIDDEEIIAGFPVATTRLTLTNNTLDAETRLSAANDAGRLALDLRVEDVRDSASSIDGQASVNVDDAGIFAALIPDITSPSGRIDGSMSVSGRLDVPELVGEINLRDGAFGVRPAGINVTDVQLSLSQDSPGSLMLRGSASSGGGTLSVRGDTRIDEVMRTDIRIEGDNFELLRLPDWQASASPNVAISVDESRTRIDGELKIPTANIRVREIPTSAEKPSSDVVVHSGDTGGADARRRRLELDLRATLGEDVDLSAFGLRTGLEGSVRLRGGERQGVLGYGRVTLEDGTYRAYGQNLTIERGSLVFNGPLDSPQLDVRAIRRIDTDNVTAGIHLTGTPTNLRSEVYSTPAMRDIEALSYLLSGRALSSSDGAADGDLLGSAAFALGLSGAGSIASSVKNELGLDTLSIRGGSQDGRIVAGKRLSDRLLVEYGYGLVDRLGSLLLRYQLNERLVLESRTGTASALDIVYRVSKP